MSRVIIENLFKIYPHPVKNIVALQDINLEIKQGEQVAIAGDSEAGKTTLIHLLGALDSPSAGEIVIHDRSITHLTKSERRAYWQQEISFIWPHPQDNLLPYMSVLENIERRTGSSAVSPRQRAMDYLTSIGLREKAHQLPKHLSRVENQLAAIATAVCSEPTLILADEPALALGDEETATIYRAISQLASAQGIIVILTAETIKPAQWAGKIIGLEHGILVENPLETVTSHLPAHIDQQGRLQIPEVIREQLGIETRAELDWGLDYLKIAAPSTNT